MRFIAVTTAIVFLIFLYIGIVAEFVRPWCLDQPEYIGFPILMTAASFPSVVLGYFVLKENK